MGRSGENVKSGSYRPPAVRQDGHLLRRGQATLWAGERCAGYLFCLEQGLEGFPRDRPVKEARHYTVGLLVEGAARVHQASEDPFGIEGGWMFQAAPGWKTGMELDRQRPYRDWLCGFDRETYALLGHLGVLPSTKRAWPVRGVQAVRAAYQRLQRRLLRQSRLELWEGVVLLCEFLKQVRHSNRHPTAGVPERLLRQAAAELESRPDPSLPVEEQLAAFGVPYDRLRKAFAVYHGMTPAQFRIRARVSAACELLAEGGRVGEVAERLGYPDPYSFSKQFKQVIGRTPKAYQQESQATG